jgi:putative phosphoesterase
MYLGVISDIHGNSLGLSAVLADLERQRVNRILVAGDLVGYYPYVNEVFELLRTWDASYVVGNHDCYLLGKLPVGEERRRSYNLDYVERVILHQNRVLLASLPTERMFEFDGALCLLCHGSPWSVEEYIYPDHKGFERFRTLKADIVVMGHTHVPMIRHVGDVLLVNSGSCGQPRDYNPLAAYALIDTETRTSEIRRVPYDIDAVCRRVAAEGFDQDLIAILRRTR